MQAVDFPERDGRNKISFDPPPGHRFRKTCHQFRGPGSLIEGPSQIELIPRSTVRMDAGLGWFRVPEEGRGFTVRTKLGRVIDLGTEFGVRFARSDKLEVHVRTGPAPDSAPFNSEIPLKEVPFTLSRPGDPQSFLSPPVPSAVAAWRRGARVSSAVPDRADSAPRSGAFQRTTPGIPGTLGRRSPSNRSPLRR